MAKQSEPQALILPDRQQEHRLVNAERETARRQLDRIPIFDCDSHVYESSSFPEIVRYMENPNMRRSFELGSPEYIQAHLIPQNIGERSVGGRLPVSQTLHDAPFEDSTDMHPVAAATVRAMDRLGIDYTVLFPTPMLNLGIHPDANIEVGLGWAFNRWLVDDVLPCDPRLRTMPYLPTAVPTACLRLMVAVAEKPGVLGLSVTCVRFQLLNRNEYLKIFT